VKLEGTSAVPGWTTIMILVALGSSAQLLVIGILGAYVGRIYEEVQRRPLYTVAREINFAAGEAPRPSSPPGSSAAAGGTSEGKTT
jgi:dolichol-phosphate mannosyltransferase